MANVLYKEINVKFSVQLERIDVLKTDKLEPIEFAVDSKGNPVEAFHIRKSTYKGYNFTLNGITVNSAVFKDRMENLMVERNSFFGVEILGTDDDKMYAITFNRLFYRMDFMEIYMNDLKTVFKQVFDVELEI